MGCFDSSGKVIAIALPQRGLAMYDATALSKPADAGAPLVPPFLMLESSMAKFCTNPQRVPAMAAGEPLPPPFPTLTSFASISFSPDGAKVALATADRGVIILDAFKPRREFAVLCAHPTAGGFECSAAWSPDSSQLAVGAADGHVWVYDVSGGPAGLTALPPQAEAFDWHPALVRAPAVVLAGEAHKSAAAAAAAFAGARAHREALHASMQASRLEFSRKMSRPLASLGPPLTLPYVPPPLAASEGEMVSRHDAPVTAVAWHPRAPLLASAARTAVLWALPAELPPALLPLVGGPVGGGGGGGAAAAAFAGAGAGVGDIMMAV